MIEYRQTLPEGVMAIEPVSRNWRFPIAQGVAQRRDIRTNEDGTFEEIYPEREGRLFPETPAFAGIPYAAGLTVLTGRTGLGKSQFALVWAEDATQKGRTTGWITLNEPAQFSEFLNTDEDVRESLFALDNLPDVVFIDSFRLLQFSVAGTTRAGGVSSGLFEMLTELNNACLAKGVMMVGLFNPLSADAEVADRYRSELESSINTLVNLKDFGSGAYRSRATDRKDHAFSLEGAVSTSASVDDSVITIPRVTTFPVNIDNRIF